MFKKFIYLIIVSLTAIVTVFSQGNVKPRDADEAEGWQIYNQYKASRAAEAAATNQIKQAVGDVATTSMSSIGLLGSDPSDRARLAALRQTVDAERQKQNQLLAKWGDKFYWRYGDLAWADDKIKDPGTKREMDRIEFALTYFPFDPNKAAKPTTGSTAGTWRPEGPWNGMQIKYSISGVTVTSTEEGGPFCCWVRTLKGDLPASGTIRVTGSVGMVGGLAAGAVVSVRSGNASKEWRAEVDPKNKPWDNFDVSVVIPQGSTSASISINMEGRYGSAAAGESRGVSVVGTFSRPAGAISPTPTPAPNNPAANTKPVVAVAGTWSCSDGGTYTIKQSGTSITWEAASADGGRTWSHTFVGTIQGDKIVGRFEDHPPGRYTNRGELTLRIVGGSKLEYFSSSVPFGGRVWNR